MKFSSFHPSISRRGQTTRLTTLLATLGLTGLVTGCAEADLTLINDVKAQAPPSPTSTTSPSPIPPAATSTPTLPPTGTTWPTPTPWPTPRAWVPQARTLPTLAPLPIAPTARVMPNGSLPVSYSPPDGVDVFGQTILRWSYYGELAPDEFFDIKIKPLGSNDSAFVDWIRSPEYELRPWSGWQPGLYTWQIGIVKGYRQGDRKQFIADTGRDSQPFLIKWQAAGGDHSGSGGSGGSSGGGGGNNSGGS